MHPPSSENSPRTMAWVLKSPEFALMVLQVAQWFSDLTDKHMVLNNHQAQSDNFQYGWFDRIKVKSGGFQTEESRGE